MKDLIDLFVNKGSWYWRETFVSTINRSLQFDRSEKKKSVLSTKYTNSGTFNC